MIDPRRLADHWLQDCYGFPLELVGPVAETPGTWVFSVAQLPVPGAPPVTSPAPMLTALVCVPKNGAPPFHLATDDPWGDLADFDRDPRPRDPATQARRTNARGCVLAAHAALSGAPQVAPQVAPPWRPEDERAVWWGEFVRRHLPAAEVGPCADWDTVIRAIDEPGPGTRGVVWLRRELNGAEATGHLLYAHNNKGRVVLLDPQAGRLARLETTNVRALVLARIAP